MRKKQVSTTSRARRGASGERWRGRARTRDGKHARSATTVERDLAEAGRERADRRAMVERSATTCGRRQCARGGRAGDHRPSPSPGRTIGGDAPHRRTASRTPSRPRRMTSNSTRKAGGQPQAGAAAMRVMGIEARPHPGTSKAAPGHKIYHLRAAEDASRTTWGGRRTSSRGMRLLIGVIIDGQPSGRRAASNTNDASFAQRRGGSALSSERRGFNTDQGSTSPPRLAGKPRRPASRFRWTDAAASWTTFHRTAGADQV